MIESFSSLTDRDLRELSVILHSRRLREPYSNFAVSQLVSKERAPSVVDDLNALAKSGFQASQIAILVDGIVKDRKARAELHPDIDVVTTGPETDETDTRDTSLVVQELFKNAQKTVVLVGYAIYQGDEIFATLARRMTDNQNLEVSFFVEIERPRDDPSTIESTLKKYKERFIKSQWPAGCREPTIYYDPRSLGRKKNSSLHAKCLVIDGKVIFVSSANFSRAGQHKNIELGITFRSRLVARQIELHFNGLVRNHSLIRLR